MSVLSDNVVLVKQSISFFDFQKFSGKISEEVAQQHGMTVKEAGRYRKKLLVSATLDAMVTQKGALYTHHVDHTLPYQDRGPRILTNAAYFDYALQQRNLKDGLLDLVKTFQGEYPDLVEERRHKGNGFFDESEYPPVGEIPSLYDVKLTFFPIPDKDHFSATLGLPEQDMAQIRKDLEANMVDVVANAVNDLWLACRNTSACCITG